MTQRRRVGKAVEHRQFTDVERELEAAFRRLPISSPEPGGSGIPIEDALPDMIRDLVMLRRMRETSRWQATKSKLERLKKHARTALNDQDAIVYVPLQVRISIHTIANLEIWNPRASKKGAPKKNIARQVAEITAERFFQLTGEFPGRRTAGEGSKAAAPGEAYGPFVDLLTSVYEILGIDASAPSQAADAVASVKKKYAPKSDD